MIVYESPQHLSFMWVIWWYFFTLIYLLSKHNAGHHHHRYKIEHVRLMVLSNLGRKFQKLVTKHHGRILKRFPMHYNQKYLVGLEQQHIFFMKNIHDSLWITPTSILYASHMMIFLHTYYLLSQHSAGHHHNPCQIEHDSLMVLSNLGRKIQNLVTQHHGILL